MNLREAAAQVVQAYDAHEPLAVVMEDLRTALAEPEHEIIQRMRRLKAEAQAEHRQAIEQGRCSSCGQELPDELKTEYQVNRDLRDAAMQKLTDIQQEMESGCDRCRSQLWCGAKCSNCGKVWEWASGIQE